MKKSTLLRLAMSFTLMLFVSGVFAQITLTIRNEDGTLSNAAEVYTQMSSAPGTIVSVKIATALGAATWTPPIGTYNYLVRRSNNLEWNAYTVNYTGVAIPGATITLSSKFNPTIQDYAANRLGNKVTLAKPMPFWVYPSPIQNPAWVAPAIVKAPVASIVLNAISTFAWTIAPLTYTESTGNNDNYVQLTFNPALVAVNATASYRLSVTETAAPAYGGCAGQAVDQYVTVINNPFIRISTAMQPATYSVLGTPVSHIVGGCQGSIAATNVTLAMDNTQEEFPYYAKLDYKVYNATLTAGNLTALIDITAATMVAFPALNVNGGVTATLVNNTINPLLIATTPRDLFGAAVTFQVMNNAVTVYQFDFQSWNAKISRKSDYVAMRTFAGDETLITDPNFVWHNTKFAAGDVIKAYVIVLPQPVTGPIYHIANTWGI